MDLVFGAGADMIFLGAPGIEIISESLFKDIIIPWSKKVSAYVHSKNKYVYSHICSPVKKFLEMGLYNELDMDLFETLSPPPFGDIDDIGRAMKFIKPEICTRGNLGLDLMIKSTPDKIYDETVNIIEKTKGRKHIVAASDYLFYEIPEDNVKAMVKAVKDYNKK
jgi:uroporphyrinogen-III decarboxylase